MYQQFIESLHQLKDWMGQVPWNELYQQAKDGLAFAKDILEFIVIAKVNNKPNEGLPPNDSTPPSPHVHSSRRRRKPQTKYRTRNFRKRK